MGAEVGATTSYLGTMLLIGKVFKSTDRNDVQTQQNAVKIINGRPLRYTPIRKYFG